MNPIEAVDEKRLGSGEMLGARDFLPRDTQLDIALGIILQLHDELGAYSRRSTNAMRKHHGELLKAIAVLGDPKAAKRDRIIGLRARRAARKIGLISYVRTRIWIARSSAPIDRQAALNTLLDISRSIEAMPTTGLAGDAPIRRLTNSGKHDEAHVWIRALAPRHMSNASFVKLARDVATKRGNLSLVLALTLRLQKHMKISPLAVRKLEGRIREVSGWVPELPGPQVPIEPESPSTILHLVKESRPYLSNGFTSRSHHNFRAEQAVGLRPVVVTEPGFPCTTEDDERPAIEFVDGIEHRRILAGSAHNDDIPIDIWLQEFAQGAYEQVREIRPAVIHASSGRRGYETALVGLALKRKTGLPLVYEVRSFFEGTWTGQTAYEEHGELFERRLAVELMCMEEADAVLTLGESMKAELVRRGVDAAKIKIIPNGVDIEKFPLVGRDQRLAHDLGIGELPTFGYVSNMDHHRESQETLIKAAALLKERGIEFRCLLVGDGPRASKLRDLRASLGLDDEIIFTGSVDHIEIPAYYSLIDVFVVPRIDERAARYVTPLKPFEAMALGKPIIASNLPALVEILAPPLRGRTFQTGSHADLADKIEELLSHQSAGAAIGARGREWVEGHRQWFMNGERYLSCYTALTSFDEASADAL